MTFRYYRRSLAATKVLAIEVSEEAKAADDKCRSQRAGVRAARGRSNQCRIKSQSCQRHRAIEMHEPDEHGLPAARSSLSKTPNNSLPFSRRFAADT